MNIKHRNAKRPTTVNAGSLVNTECFKYAGSEEDAVYMIIGDHHRDYAKKAVLDMNTGSVYSVQDHHQVVPINAELTVWEKKISDNSGRSYVAGYRKGGL